VELFLIGTQCGASDALYTVGRWRFDRQFTASSLQALDQRLDLSTGFSSTVIAQPSSQGKCIGYCGLAESESRSNLGAKAFRRSFSDEQAAIGRDAYLDLSRQGGDIQSLQIGWPAWEPTVIAEKHQPRCKREWFARFLAITVG